MLQRFGESTVHPRSFGLIGLRDPAGTRASQAAPAYAQPLRPIADSPLTSGGVNEDSARQSAQMIARFPAVPTRVVSWTSFLDGWSAHEPVRRGWRRR